MPGGFQLVADVSEFAAARARADATAELDSDTGGNEAEGSERDDCHDGQVQFAEIPTMGTIVTL